MKLEKMKKPFNFTHKGTEYRILQNMELVRPLIGGIDCVAMKFSDMSPMFRIDAEFAYDKEGTK